MSEFKGTPGPWQRAMNPGGPGDQPAFPSVRDNSGAPDGGDIVCMPLGDSETVKANALLIAAAPDLLAALEKMTERFSSLVALLETEDDDPDYMEDRKATADAEAAIAKATEK